MAKIEATSLCQNMFNEVYNVDNLTPCSFFDDLGKHIIPAVTFDPATRPANIAYTNFLCQIDGNQVDPRIKQPAFTSSGNSSSFSSLSFSMDFHDYIFHKLSNNKLQQHHQLLAFDEGRMMREDSQKRRFFNVVVE
jgi:hypothetical protein